MYIYNIIVICFYIIITILKIFWTLYFFKYFLIKNNYYMTFYHLKKMIIRFFIKILKSIKEKQNLFYE